MFRAHRSAAKSQSARLAHCIIRIIAIMLGLLQRNNVSVISDLVPFPIENRLPNGHFCARGACIDRFRLETSRRPVGFWGFSMRAHEARAARSNTPHKFIIAPYQCVRRSCLRA
jgi:hypothetical protein